MQKNAPWMSVPQFGDWDQKGPLPDYSMDFSKIRQNRKQNKRDISRASIGNEEDLISSNTVKLNTTNNSAPHHSYGEDHHSPTVSIFTFNLSYLSSRFQYYLYFITYHISNAVQILFKATDSDISNQGIQYLQFMSVINF